MTTEQSAAQRLWGCKESRRKASGFVEVCVCVLNGWKIFGEGVTDVGTSAGRRLYRLCV
jgi:hypothetical protein